MMPTDFAHGCRYRQHTTRWFVAALINVVALTPVLSQVPETRAEVITGRVSKAGSIPFAGVVIIATMAPDRLTFVDTTTATGEYIISVPKGTGDYLIYIAAPGYSTFRKRLIRAGTEATYRLDATLVVPVTQLATVQVAARKVYPQRGSNGPIEVGSAERMSETLVGALSPELAGDLNALASIIPGINPVAGGYSTLGLGPSQNTATLNGAAFSAGALPRDVRTYTRTSTSTFDPARGWFSGGNVNVELLGNGLFASSRAHVTLDAPVMQAGGRGATSTVQPFTNVRLSYGADGPLTWENKYFYNLGVQADRRTSNFASLLNATPDVLRHAGVAANSTALLMSAMDSAHVSVNSNVLPDSRTTDNISMLLRLERSHVVQSTRAPVTTTFGIMALGQQSRDRATGIHLLSAPSRGGESVQQSAMVEGKLSHFFGRDYLHEVRSIVSWNNRNETSPLALPEGRVFVQSELEGDTDGLTTLLFGGNSGGNRSTRQFTWETINTTKFYAKKQFPHALKITSDVRYDGYRNDVRGNPFGTFTYASLDDVSGGQPISFSRTLSSPVRTGGAWNAFAAITDNWRPSTSFQMMYGARVEASTFTARPAYNQLLDNALGARTDFAPTSFHVSPRVGFTWFRSASPNGVKTGPAGSYALNAPKYLRGGIGEFRSMISPSLLAEPRVATGLSNSAERLLCIAESTPAVDWQSYSANAANIPSECRSGASSSFADGAPNVRLIGKGYQAPTSWRANLSYGSRTFHFDWTLDGTYSINLHQPGSTDLNFNPTAQFNLADDARPVFAPLSAIVPSSGLISSTASRTTNAYARVVSSNSDLRSVSRQFTLSVRPEQQFMRNWFANASYTWANNRSQSRGFDGATFASPTEKYWGRGDFDVRHQLQSNFGYSRGGFTVAGLARLQSGLPYTPIIAGDVNGDGLSNDRAFIANPADLGNAAQATAMRELLSSGSSSVRQCLKSQMGRVAERNSCTGPWNMTMNAQLSLANRALLRRRITSIALSITNPLAAIDRLANGSANAKGWGSYNIPDANLLAVRGFNAETRQFQYTVNQRFGQTQALSTLSRAPFRVTLDIAMDLARPVARQQLNQWLRPGRAGKAGKRLTKADLKLRYERNVADPFKLVMQNTDSLLLNRAQVELLQASQLVYRAQLDSIWIRLASDMEALGDQFDDADALKRQEAALDQAWEITRLAVHAKVVPVLNRMQLALMPSWVVALYRVKQPGGNFRMYMPPPG